MPRGGRLVLVALRGGSEWLLAGLDLHREDRPGLSGLYRAFTMACICCGAKGSATTVALAPPEMSFLLAGVSACLVLRVSRPAVPKRFSC